VCILAFYAAFGYNTIAVWRNCLWRNCLRWSAHFNEIAQCMYGAWLAPILGVQFAQLAVMKLCLDVLTLYQSH